MDKVSMMSQLQEAKDLEKRIKDDERTRAKEDIIRSGEDASKTIVFPKYKMDERLKIYKEVDPPSSKLYIGLGWDENRDSNVKHYRKYYEDELENDRELFASVSPFNTYTMKKGQARGASTGMFSAAKKDDSGQASTEVSVGIFKGIIEVENKEDKEKYLKKKDILLDDLKSLVN